MLPARHHRPPCRPIAPLTLAIAGALFSIVAPAFAQESKDNATDLARIEVTGSNIRRTDVETASPVQVISKQDIQNMGARTLLQVLDNLPAARPAQQDARSLFTGSDGASQAN
ncbi:TonB-dependent receptor, partial [Stenotrophomonas maltophilia]|nr:TonB-dependent receptor [Stenotrophomonas maltophilia]